MAEKILKRFVIKIEKSMKKKHVLKVSIVVAVFVFLMKGQNVLQVLILDAQLQML